MELYSTVLSKDRGSLGLLFELNSILGVVLAFYTTLFVFSGRSKVQNEQFLGLEKFVWIQSMLCCGALVCIPLTFLCFWIMELRIKYRKNKKSNIKEEGSL